ncbi:MAG: chorismate synthase, partial [Eubacteriales bacterium]|nr:chorismate synthase [Eubacteriales bacterium]
MSSEFGKRLHITVFGQSHGRAIGITAEDLPAGEPVDMEELTAFLARRRPGRNPLSTARREDDKPVFLSGLENGVLCGAPLCAVIKNRDAHSEDYAQAVRIPRPGHADFTAWQKWGTAVDLRGGGHFSGRLTAPLCIVGGIALQILARRGVYIGSHVLEIAGECDEAFPLHPDRELFALAASRDLPVLNADAGERMREAILRAAAEGDSVGGILECAVIGLKAGVGGPMFDGIEGRLAQAMFGIPAVKGVEFGAGFAAARMRGTENNDPFVLRDGKVETETNHCGGILGGLSTGMPVVFRAAFKPTPSIAKPQRSVDLDHMQETVLEIKGRHDP